MPIQSLPLPRAATTTAGDDEEQTVEEYQVVERSDVPGELTISPHTLQQRHDQFQISRLTVSPCYNIYQ